jgi:uncharacterized protein (DUF1501 family)
MSGFSEFRPARRALLVGLGAGAMSLSFPGVSLAVPAARGERKLVLVILRGALDGLSAVPMYGDPNYSAVRGGLAIGAPGSPDGAFDLGGGFGLHPKLAFLAERYRAGDAAVFHAISGPYRGRSHFDGQDVLESGEARVFAADHGWLNRALTAGGDTVRFPASAKGLAIGQTMPLVLRGEGDVASWAPSTGRDVGGDTMARLMDLYSSDRLLGPALAAALETNSMAGADSMMGAQRGMGRGGNANLNGIFGSAARFLTSPDGPAAVVIGVDGWDTHANQGGATGQLATRLGALDEGLSALKQGLGPTWSNTVVMVVTEFGRTVAINGTRGSDHGTGGAAFVLGGAVRGGKVYGDWPGLSERALFEGRDLAPANDLRGLFRSTLAGHWGVDTRALDTRVFPGSANARGFDGLIRSA